MVARYLNNDTMRYYRNMYEITTDQKLADADAYPPRRHGVCTHQVAALYVMAAILKV